MYIFCDTFEHKHVYFSVLSSAVELLAKQHGRRRRGQGWGGGDDADMRRDGGGRISERYSSCLHSLPRSLPPPSSFIHSFNLVSARCRVTDDMDGRADDSQVKLWGNVKMV